MSKASSPELELHERLLCSDPTASAELADAFLSPVIAGLRRRCSGIRDDVLITEAAIDAILDYAQQPSKYSPERMGLLEYLVMSARGDLLNAVKREAGIATKTVPFSAVENDPDARNRLMDVAVCDQYDVEAQHCSPELLERVQGLMEDPVDAEIVRLMMSGERRTAEYARVLRIEGLDKAERERVVKQNKDRLKKRLRRLGVGTDD